MEPPPLLVFLAQTTTTAKIEACPPPRNSSVALVSHAQPVLPWELWRRNPLLLSKEVFAQQDSSAPPTPQEPKIALLRPISPMKVNPLASSAPQDVFATPRRCRKQLIVQSANTAPVRPTRSTMRNLAARLDHTTPLPTSETKMIVCPVNMVATALEVPPSMMALVMRPTTAQLAPLLPTATSFPMSWETMMQECAPLVTPVHKVPTLPFLALSESGSRTPTRLLVSHALAVSTATKRPSPRMSLT